MTLRSAAATGLGLILTGIGIAGYVIPGLPGTIFLIWALACFKVGNPRLEKWLLNHRLVGPTLRDWDENRWMPARIKVLVVSIITLSTAGSLFRIHFLWARVLLVALAVYGVWFILNLRTKPVGGKLTPTDR
ncbi:MAG: YbaN family protein [Chthonomonas sp.]|nr:YbaN family protein [Chthonomonas sp.]